MKCRDVMQTDLQWVSTNQSASDAALLMRNNSVGFLLVRDPSADRLVGVVTDRDLTTRVCAEGKAPNDVKVADVMSRNVVACIEDEPLSDAETRMRDHEKGRLVVLDIHRKPIGVISLTDILLHDRGGRALKTARAVLGREGERPHQPINSIHLTPSTVEDEEQVAQQQPTVAVGGSWGGTMKEFP
jgi:CBS-domain-containing membrane protein